MEDGEAGAGPVITIADDIGVGHGPGGDELLLAQGRDGGKLVAQGGGALKGQVLGGLLHLLPQLLCHLLVAPLQDGGDLGHPRMIVRLGAAELTPAVAVAHVVIQARAGLAKVPGELLVAAGQAEGQAQGVKQMLGHAAAGKGAEVLGAVVLGAVFQGDRRVVLPQVQAQIGVALGVL